MNKLLDFLINCVALKGYIFTLSKNDILNLIEIIVEKDGKGFRRLINIDNLYWSFSETIFIDEIKCAIKFIDKM